MRRFDTPPFRMLLVLLPSYFVFLHAQCPHHLAELLGGVVSCRLYVCGRHAAPYYHAVGAVVHEFAVGISPAARLDEGPRARFVDEVLVEQFDSR